MSLFSASTFRERVFSLQTDAFRAFVADLWSARGFETSIEGSVVIASHPDDETGRELIAVEPRGDPGDCDGRIPASEFTIVVSRDPGGEVAAWAGQGRVLGYEDIREMLLYSVPRADAAPIVRRHLDCDLTAATTSASSRDTGTIRDTVAMHSTWLLLVSTVLVAVFVVTATVSGPGIEFGQSSREDGTVATPTPAPTRDSGTVVEESGTSVVPCPDTPTEAIQYQLNVLANGSGVRTVWDFGTQEFRRYSGTYRDFNVSMHSHPFEHLLAPASVTSETVERSATTATGEVTVLDDRGVQYDYIFTLSLVDEKGTDCWRTDGLIYEQS